MLIDFCFSFFSYVYAFSLFMLSRLLSQTCNVKNPSMRKNVHKKLKLRQFVPLCYLQHFAFSSTRNSGEEKLKHILVRNLLKMHSRENIFKGECGELCRLKLEEKSSRKSDKENSNMRESEPNSNIEI